MSTQTFLIIYGICGLLTVIFNIWRCTTYRDVYVKDILGAVPIFFFWWAVVALYIFIEHDGDDRVFIKQRHKKSDDNEKA